MLIAISMDSDNIDKINVNVKNEFDDYKFSILLTEDDSEMVWNISKDYENRKRI